MIEYIPIVCPTVDSADGFHRKHDSFLWVALTFDSLNLVLGHH